MLGPFSPIMSKDGRAVVGFELVLNPALGPFQAQVSLDIRDSAPRDATLWPNWGSMTESELKGFRSALGCRKPKGGKGRGKGRGKGPNKGPPKAPPKSGKPPPKSGKPPPKSGKHPPKSGQLKSQVFGPHPKHGAPVDVPDSDDDCPDLDDSWRVS